MRLLASTLAIVVWFVTIASAATVGKTAQRSYEDGCVQYWVHHDAVALNEFAAASRADPSAPMPHLMQSRIYLRMGRLQQAESEIQRAVSSLSRATDEDRYLIRAWAAHVDGTTHVARREAALEDARRTAETGIAIYPESVELYLLRGELEPNPVREAPYFLAARRLNPRHPFTLRWYPPNLPLPQVACGPGETVSPPSQSPRLFSGLGAVHMRITTRDPRAQAYFTQGLCCLYAYVSPPASSAFLAAIKFDPHCAMAYWGLSFCTGQSYLPLPVAEKALALARQFGTVKEQWYCSLRVLQLQGRPDQFLYDLCGAMVHFPDDVDLWVWRATWRGFLGETGDDGRTLQGIPFDLAARRIQPDHPSPNHELIHGYEIINRPMLGWPYTWGFRRSAPNLPHAQHMQAHLAMRLGRWKEALQCTERSVRLSQEGFPELDRDHHLNILMWALGHEGCFRAAQAAPRSRAQDLSWPRMLRLKLDDKALAAWAHTRLNGSGDGWYLGALANLDQGHWQAAKQQLQHFKDIRGVWYGADLDDWRTEVDSRIQYESGKQAQGIAAVRAIARWVDAIAGTSAEGCRWGQGAYYDNLWAEMALGAGRLDEAQEAFCEGLAHEHGSIVAVLGLQVVSERKHQATLAASYAARAQAVWSQADPGARDRLLARLRAIANRRAEPF
ncbi:MAG TPA: hypothetical protein VGO93_01735 [Candidatus Xenobia bacterium]|jgi:tetratricopeptide (TPR) repeat protein